MQLVCMDTLMTCSPAPGSSWPHTYIQHTYTETHTLSLKPAVIREESKAAMPSSASSTSRYRKVNVSLVHLPPPPPLPTLSPFSSVSPILEGRGEVGPCAPPAQNLTHLTLHSFLLIHDTVMIPTPRTLFSFTKTDLS
eukprot:Sspe_Gene.111361::Locus_93407_Transcript_1_1_Confidence_1.000_Length_593::g.111361::m.111361